MRQLHVEYAAMVEDVCSNFLSIREDQEDAAQDILLKLSTLNIPETENEGGYVYRVISNVLKDFIRKNKRRIEVEARAAMEESVDEDDPLTVMEREEEEEVTEILISDLPIDLRVTAELYYYKGLDYKTIADELSIPEGTVASRLNKARKLLQGEWNETSRYSSS